MPLVNPGGGITANWSTWVPTLTPLGSMTYTSQVINYAKYVTIGQILHFSVDFEGVVGGVPSSGVVFSLPVAGVDTSGMVVNGYVSDGGLLTVAFGNALTTSSFGVYKYTTAALTAGTVRFTVAGFYEIP